MPDPILEKHGTQLMVLKPSSIWAAAMSDLERRAHNRATGDFQHYAFHRKHVAKAETANDIIRAAIRDIGLGRASSKRATRLLYADAELLEKALR